MQEIGQSPRNEEGKPPQYSTNHVLESILEQGRKHIKMLDKSIDSATSLCQISRQMKIPANRRVI